MCGRDVLHMLSDFSLINDRLSTKVVLQTLASQDARIYGEEDCNLELEVSSLSPHFTFNEVSVEPSLNLISKNVLLSILACCQFIARFSKNLYLVLSFCLI